MSEPFDTWTDRLQDLGTDVDAEKAEGFVQELYRAAQVDLDQERAQADFEREE